MTSQAFRTVRATEWGTTFDGHKFRIVVMDACPVCRVCEAHALQFADIPSENRCQVCTRHVVIDPEPEAATPAVITVWREEAEHAAECARCATSGETGRGCPEDIKFFERKKGHEKRHETPWLVRRERRYGTGYAEVRHTACWTEAQAKAQASVQGGEIIDQTHLYVVA